MGDPELRASDADRHRVAAQLQRHTAAGRLTLDEYAERIDRVLVARTHGDLADVVRDLPADPPPAQGPPGSAGQLGVAFVVALAALVIVSLLVLLGR